MGNYQRIVITLIVFIAAAAGIIFFSTKTTISEIPIIHKGPVPASIKLNLDEDIFQSIVNNPNALSIQLTLINQAPPRIVSKQTHDNIEAMIITLSGTGEVKVQGVKFNNKILPMSQSHIVYCPPNTEFSIINTGKKNLKYLYIIIDVL